MWVIINNLKIRKKYHSFSQQSLHTQYSNCGLRFWRYQCLKGFYGTFGQDDFSKTRRFGFLRKKVELLDRIDLSTQPPPPLASSGTNSKTGIALHQSISLSFYEMKWIGLNWARRTSWGWWDDWDDTVLQTQDSKFEPWRSEAEHATSRSQRLPTSLSF